MTAGGEVPAMSRVLRALICAALLFGALSGAAVQASTVPKPPSDRVTLGRKVLTTLKTVTVVRAGSTGSARVTIPRDVRIDTAVKLKSRTGPNADLRIQGPAKTVGIALLTPDFRGTLAQDRFLLGGRFNSCNEACEKPTALNHLLLAGDGKLKAGTYVLHVVTDAPVEITLSLAGAPKGTSEIQIESSASAELPRPDERRNEMGELTEYAAGATFEAGAVGFSVAALHLRGKDLNPDGFGICQYDVAAPPVAEAYGPQCAALTRAMGTGTFFLWNPVQTENEVVLMTTFLYNDSGDVNLALTDERGLGGWATVRGDLTHASFSGFFIKAKD